MCSFGISSFLSFRIVQFIRESQGSKEHESGSAPFTSNYMDYVMGDDDEGFVRLEETQVISAECPSDSQSWQVRERERDDD